ATVWEPRWHFIEWNFDVDRAAARRLTSPAASLKGLHNVLLCKNEFDGEVVLT
ncbi:hypothetical protein BaRGS_00029432, partial [Batillaria attramentaria]